MLQRRYPKPRIQPIILILLAATSGGCDAPWSSFGAARREPVAEKGEPDVARPQLPLVPDGSVEELFRLAQESEREAEELAQLLAASETNRQSRMTAFKRHIDTGVAAVDKLLLQSAVSEQQRYAARQLRLKLLYQGAKLDGDEFLPRLKAFVDDIKQQDPASPLSGAGAACVVELEYLLANRADTDLLPALVEYAKNYPACAMGVVLFQKYGEKLERADRRGDAMHCYRTGIDLYGQLSAVASLQERLAQLQQSEKAELRQSQAKQNKLSRIRSQLGSGDDGYFLIFAREVKDSSETGFSLYSFEYEVFHGMDAAVSYVYGLKPNWKWELIRRFPDTPDAFREATGVAEELTKNRAFIRY